LRFLVDAQLPSALARQIEALGHTAEHVADRGLATAADRDIRAYAARVGAVIITKDEDSAVRKLLESGPPVVWVRIGNTRR
jgi:predicted nuclease of predicted toxin-antitoxin system